MEKTSLGLTVLAPEDTLDADNYSFQSVNPVIIDHLLSMLVALTGLLDPVLGPTLSSALTGGTIESDTDIEVTFTYVDENGGETAGAPPATITTIAPLEAPEEAPALALDNTAGTVVAGNYEYAITLTDGHGGETPVGPAAIITRTPGPANARITVSGLSDLVESVPGASGWRLYRAKNSGPLYFLAEGDDTDDNVVDTGLPADCATVAPGEGDNTTNNTNTLSVTVPDEGIDATFFRIYAGVGTIASPALLGEYPIADAGSVKVFTELLLDLGQPPDYSLAYGRIMNEAPPGSGHTVYDEGVELAQRAMLDFLGPGVTVTDNPTEGKTVVTIPGGGGGGGEGGGHTIHDEDDPLAARAILAFEGAGVTVTDDSGGDRTVVTIPGGGGGSGGGGGAAAASSRMTVHLTAPDTDPGMHNIGEVAIAPGYSVLQVKAVDGATRVRLYDRAATRDADVDRPAGVAPEGDHGLMLDADVSDDEFISPSEIILNLSPPAAGYNLDDPVTDAVYYTLSNSSEWDDGALAVDLLLIPSERLSPPQRMHVSLVATAVAAGTHFPGSVTIAPGWRLLSVAQVTGESRVRLYDREDRRDADLDRGVSFAPEGDHGLMFDGDVTDDNPQLNLTPPVDGYNLDDPVSNVCWFTLDNTGTGTVAVEVDLTLVPMEAL